MLIIGLTGGIASGKNFVADIFYKKFRIPNFDADLAVHEIYRHNSAILKQIKKHFPSAVVNNQINRDKLANLVLKDNQLLLILENIIHPQVKKKQEEFIKRCQRRHCKAIILNIPLLFEKQGYKKCHKSILVSAGKFVQKQRFLKRVKKHKSDASLNDYALKFDRIISNQMPDSQKKKLADFIVYNGLNKGRTVSQITKIIKKLKL